MKALQSLEDPAAGRPRMAMQGLIYIVGGLWPLVHYRSFSKALRPASDARHVKAMGGVFALAGAVLVVAGLRAARAGQPVSPPSVSLAGLMAAVEMLTAFRGKVVPLTLAQHAIEAAAAARRLAATPEATPPEAPNRRPLPPDLA